MKRWMTGVALTCAAVGCDPWPTSPRDAAANDVSAPQDVPNTPGTDVQGPDVQGPDVQGPDVQDAGTPGTDVQGADVAMADVQGPDVQDVPPPDVPPAGDGGIRVISQGIVTVGPGATAPAGSLRVVEQGFEFGETQCNSGMPRLCWSGGIVP